MCWVGLTLWDCANVCERSAIICKFNSVSNCILEAVIVDSTSCF